MDRGRRRPSDGCRSGGDGDEEEGRVGLGFEKLPESLQHDIFSRLDLESLFSAAAVSRALRSPALATLSSITVLDLSGFAPTLDILRHVLHGVEVLESLTIDCTLLYDSAIDVFTKESLRELVLLKCFYISSDVFFAVGEKCYNLRLLSVEMECHYIYNTPASYVNSISKMLGRCTHLESLQMKFQNKHTVVGDIEFSRVGLPICISNLLLQPISNLQMKSLIESWSISKLLSPKNFQLHSLSLVLDCISDDLVFAISSKLHHLTELCLEDRPLLPNESNDLTNSGLEALAACKNLKRLSLTRNKQLYPESFKLVNDMGIFVLAEGCQQLETIRLGGFSKVTDAGYESILHSCRDLKRFEVVNCPILSDLAFHNLADTSCSLVDVKLISCNALTSESLKLLSLCKTLEVLDLSNCKSIADYGLNSLSKLCNLITLDLGGADITDRGLSILGRMRSPIISLSLRGCKRICDRGIESLLKGKGFISKSLSILDLSFMPGVSDRSIHTITEACTKLSDLCIRSCFHVTDQAIEHLATFGGGGNRSLKRLDLFKCKGLSANTLKFLTRPNFCGLRWIGLGCTSLSAKEDKLASLDRPGLCICVYGCDMGCKNAWLLH